MEIHAFQALLPSHPPISHHRNSWRKRWRCYSLVSQNAARDLLPKKEFVRLQTAGYQDSFAFCSQKQYLCFQNLNCTQLSSVPGINIEWWDSLQLEPELPKRWTGLKFFTGHLGGKFSEVVRESPKTGLVPLHSEVYEWDVLQKNSASTTRAQCTMSVDGRHAPDTCPGTIKYSE